MTTEKEFELLSLLDTIHGMARLTLVVNIIILLAGIVATLVGFGSLATFALGASVFLLILFKTAVLVLSDTENI